MQAIDHASHYIIPSSGERLENLLSVHIRVVDRMVTRLFLCRSQESGLRGVRFASLSHTKNHTHLPIPFPLVLYDMHTYTYTPPLASSPGSLCAGGYEANPTTHPCTHPNTYHPIPTYFTSYPLTPPVHPI